MKTHARRVLYGVLFGVVLGLLALVFEYAPVLAYALIVAGLLYLLGWVIDAYREAKSRDSREGERWMDT